MISPHPYPLSPVTRFLTLSALLAATVAPCSAATINYGNFGPAAGVSFLQVEETSITDALPLYGAPDLFAVGLDFDPAGFASTTTGGGIDTTIGQLNFSILTDPNVGITTVAVFEAGDYTLAGTGTALTSLTSGVILRVTVTQVNGVNIAPTNLIPVFGSVGFNLAANPGVAQPWSLGVGLDVDAQVTAAFGPGSFATGLDVSIDNSLVTTSEDLSTAFDNKTEFQITLDTLVIPEPSTGLLVLGGLIALPFARRRRRS